MKRNVWILLAILVLLVLATLVVMQQPGEVSSSGSGGKVLVDYDSSAVDKLEIISTKLAVTLERQGGKWMLTSPLRYQANETFVAEAVGKGKHIEVSKPVSTNPENQFRFEVDTTGTRVQMYERGTLKAVFFVGKASPSFTETYVRPAGSNDVYLTNGILTSTFNRRLEDWRERTVFKTDQEGIKNVKFTYGDTTFTLALKDSLWKIGNDSTVQPTVKSFLSTLANVQADEFVDSALADAPKLTAAIEVNGIQLRFYATKDATKYFVQTSESPQWYVLQQWRVTQLLKRKKEFLPAAKT
jgi:hypothetical protein